MVTIPDSNNECICKVVRQAARLLTNAYDKALAPSSLRTTQFTMLSVLARKSVASVSELSEILGLDQTTTTRNVSVLENAGLIVRRHHDPRVKLVKLTSKGKQKRQIACQHWQKVQGHISSSLSDEEWKTFQAGCESKRLTFRGARRGPRFRSGSHRQRRESEVLPGRQAQRDRELPRPAPVPLRGARRRRSSGKGNPATRARSRTSSQAGR